MCKYNAFRGMIKRVFLIPCVKRTCITYGKKHTFNIWYSIHALNVRFITYVQRMFYVLNVKQTLHFLLCIVTYLVITFVMPFVSFELLQL